MSLGFLDTLVRLRNETVDRAMSALASADPLQDNGADSPPKAPRGELADFIPRVVEISVVLGDDDPIGMKVLSTSTKRAILSVELCDATLAVLLKGAKAQVPAKRKIPARNHVGKATSMSPRPTCIGVQTGLLCIAPSRMSTGPRRRSTWP